MPKIIRTKPRTAAPFPANPNHRDLAALTVVAQQLNKSVKQQNIDNARQIEERGFDQTVFQAYQDMEHEDFVVLAEIMIKIETAMREGPGVESCWIESQEIGPLDDKFFMILNDRGYDVKVSDEHVLIGAFNRHYEICFGDDAEEDAPEGWTLYMRRE